MAVDDIRVDVPATVACGHRIGEVRVVRVEPGMDVLDRHRVMSGPQPRGNE